MNKQLPRDANIRAKNSVKVSYFYNSLYVVLNMILPLIAAPYLSRVLGVDGIGTYAYNYSLAQFFILIAKLGLVNYGARELSRAKNAEEKSAIFSNLFAMQIISTTIASACYLLYFMLFTNTNYMIAAIFFVWVLFSFLDIDWFWFGEEEFKKVSMRNIAVKLLTVLSTFLIIKKSDQTWVYALITVVGSIVGYTSIWFGVKKRVRIQKPKLSTIRRHALPCSVMLIPVLALSIYRSMDKVMLGAMSGMNDAGIYENGEKLVYCLSCLISSLGTVMLPKMSYLAEIKDEEKIREYMLRSLKFMVMLTSAMSFGLMSISGSVIPIIFGESFARSSNVLFLCAPILIFMGWSNVFRTQFIIPHKLDSIYVKSIAFGSVINVTLNLILIPRFAIVGAIIGTLAAEVFVPLYQYNKLRKKIPYALYLRETAAYVIIGAIMFAVLMGVEAWLGRCIVALLIQIAIGSILYVLLTLLYIRAKDKKLYAYVNSIIKRKVK